MFLKEGAVHRWSKGSVSCCPESLGFIGNAVISFIHSEKKKKAAESYSVPGTVLGTGNTLRDKTELARVSLGSGLSKGQASNE